MLFDINTRFAPLHDLSLFILRGRAPEVRLGGAPALLSPSGETESRALRLRVLWRSPHSGLGAASAVRGGSDNRRTHPTQRSRQAGPIFWIGLRAVGDVAFLNMDRGAAERPGGVVEQYLALNRIHFAK